MNILLKVKLIKIIGKSKVGKSTGEPTHLVFFILFVNFAHKVCEFCNLLCISDIA